MRRGTMHYKEVVQSEGKLVAGQLNCRKGGTILIIL